MWWDPHVLELEVDARGGLRDIALLGPGDGRDVGAQRIEDHLAWVARRAARIERGATPSWNARSVTSIAYDPDLDAIADVARPSVEITDAPREARPSGKRFGTLLHEVLAESSLDASPEEIRAIAAHFGRVLGANDEETAHASLAAECAHRHPILARARAARHVRREAPISVELEDGTRAEGVVDLAFVDETGWTVVDYKSDIDRTLKPEHIAQLDLYARAIREATGERVRTALLFV